jgi:hypothetical protein
MKNSLGQKPAQAIVTLPPPPKAMADRTTTTWQFGRKTRRERGNLAKSLRRQIGRFYDAKKARYA